MFTELYAAGAECIVRYGSDDLKNPPPGEENIIKIVDETDNLYGFNRASAVPESEWGKSIFASKMLIDALNAEAKERKIKIDYRVCHHLENYHALRSPNLFSPEREKILNEQLSKLKRTDKKESFDMESAVLFRVAKDFGRHAIAVLQTVNKENPKEGPYEGKNLEDAVQRENEFICFILTALTRIKLYTTLG
jgi:purine-nucleoside phosphorylase